MKHEKVVVLDFGGQYAHLIANRIRRHGVYSEIRDADTPAEHLKHYKGIILSGGPTSVNAENAPICDKEIFNLGVPILGICYGHQLMQHVLGGTVAQGKTKEYGFAELSITKAVGIFKNLKNHSRVWMSHFDLVKEPATGFEVIGETSDCPTAALANFDKNLYGIQFHAEVTHTEQGMDILDNFLNICKVQRDWSIEQFIKEEIEIIKKKIGDKKVFLLVSGGVDSTVCFALLEEALGKDRVYGLLVDHGMMRKDEAENVRRALAQVGFENLHVVDKSDKFLGALKGIADPEKKRVIIGELFWETKEEVAEELKLNPDEWIMGQGTIYPDTIETGGTKHADKIKTHHNRVDLVQEMIKAGKVIEPIAQLYKDEVRDLGEKLGLPHDMVWRHPFPGPGLGVRILCVSEKDKTDSESSSEAQNFLKLNRKIEDYLKENFSLDDVKARVLPIKSVGVQGDERTYLHPVALWTKNRDWKVLEKISTTITNRFFDVNRVILALHGEVGDFSLKPADTNRDRIRILQEANQVADATIRSADKKTREDIWQFPVVLAPVSTESGKESIILRPVSSTEAMTASFTEIDWAVVDDMVHKVVELHEDITHIFYDLTHKPPGTIEWE